MQLEDFFDYKNQMVKDIITNETIVSLIKMDTPIEEAESLIYTHVFPYEYIPETVQKGQTFVCIDVDIQSVSSKTFLTPIIYVWVFAHSSNIRLPEGGVRTDKLCSEICKVVNGSRYYGLGELNLYSVKRFAPMTDYQGKLMTFTAREFNRQFDGAKSTPSNRKEGR